MSATLDNNNGSWKKRQHEDSESVPLDLKELKRPRLYYFRLASESSRCSEDDTESICSIQDKSTDIVRDTSDTDSRADDLSEYEVEIEYEVASSSDGEGVRSTVSSTDSEGMVLSAAAAFIIDTSLEAWITDVEDSDGGNSTCDETSFGRTDFWHCVQCHGQNDNPLYRYCEKCFQARKRFFPPRPRRNKRNRNKQEKKNNSEKSPVKLDLLRNCLSGLSQDSGIGSSQECPLLDLDRIVVPDTSFTSKSGTSTAKEDISTNNDTLLSPDESNKERDTPNNSSSVSDIKNDPIASKRPRENNGFLISLDENNKERNNAKDILNNSVSEVSSKSNIKHDLRASKRAQVENNCQLLSLDNKEMDNGKDKPSSSLSKVYSRKEMDNGSNKTPSSVSKVDSGKDNVKDDPKPSKRLRKSSENLFDDSDVINETSTPKVTFRSVPEDRGRTYLNLDHHKTRRKRTFSESSLSDYDDVKKPRLSSRNAKHDVATEFTTNPHAAEKLSQNSAGGLSSVGSSSQASVGSLVEPSSQGSQTSQSESELCLFCNNAPKDSIFLHTNIAHRCCCYRCAKKTLKTTRRCPICNRSVNKVLKIFTS